MNNTKKFIKALVKGVKDGLVNAIASTEATDRDGEIIKADGWDLNNYVKNPVLLWSHKPDQLPIGKITNIKIDNGNLTFDATFAEKENEFAKQVADLFKGGFLNAFSVGFMPIERDENVITKAELLEISAVNVPANAQALNSREYKAFSEIINKTMDKKAINEKPVDITEDYIRIRVEDPSKFVDESFRTIDISAEEKIKAVIGKYKEDPEGETHIQSYLFDKTKWTAETAQAWVEGHKKAEIEVKSGRTLSNKTRQSIESAILSAKNMIKDLKNLIDSSDVKPEEEDEKKKEVKKEEIKEVIKKSENKILSALKHLNDSINN